MDIGAESRTVMADLIHRQAALDTLAEMHGKTDEDGYVWIVRSDAWWRLETLPPAESEIDYQDCANAMLKMWMDNVVTDGEYNRIMDKLNAFWGGTNG